MYFLRFLQVPRVIFTFLPVANVCFAVFPDSNVFLMRFLYLNFIELMISVISVGLFK